MQWGKTEDARGDEARRLRAALAGATRLSHLHLSMEGLAASAIEPLRDDRGYSLGPSLIREGMRMRAHVGRFSCPAD